LSRKKFPFENYNFKIKKESAYLNSLSKIQILFANNITTVIIDFEISLKNSITKIFTSAAVYGCSFHFSQNIWRKIQELELVCSYKMI
jgi:transposase-like protein